eukprot:TRINITY_DN35056_c0_g1_i1.p1 TRINITY_DN35056_c0_g1~~TRINITY_DN35056_c0_g1_i1.p1  ORF type:complete len:151 (-),score=15.48 TRINITY_DN35056_c0_g1_i1:104-556(-)
MSMAEVWSETSAAWVPINSWKPATPEGLDAESKIVVHFTISVGGENVECRKVLPLSSCSLRGVVRPDYAKGHGKQTSVEEPSKVTAHLGNDDIEEADPDAFPGLGSPDRPGYYRDFLYVKKPNHPPNFGHRDGCRGRCPGMDALATGFWR